MPIFVASEQIELQAHVSVPESQFENNATSGTHGLLLLHGFPQDQREVQGEVSRYQELSERIATQVDMTVLTIAFRGTGGSGGDFSLGGWARDISAGVGHMVNDLAVDNVWVAGFGVGAALALVHAAADDRIRGVAAFSARAHFDDWAQHSEQAIAYCRSIGLISTPGFPSDPNAWSAEFTSLRPIDHVASIGNRPVLLVHGSQDERVPVSDARDLANEIGATADLRIVHGASHRLRHDPRVVALLLGWLGTRR